MCTANFWVLGYWNFFSLLLKKKKIPHHSVSPQPHASHFQIGKLFLIISLSLSHHPLSLSLWLQLQWLRFSKLVCPPQSPSKVQATWKDIYYLALVITSVVHFWLCTNRLNYFNKFYCSLKICDYWMVMLASVLRTFVKNSVKENFYGKRKK